MLIGVATSFVFAAILDLLIVAQQRALNRDRVRFFGEELVHHETTLVYPDFVLHEDIRATLSSHNQQLIFQRPESRFTGLTVHRIDVPSLVASNDIQSLLYVSSIFDSTADCPNVMVVDSKILDDCDRSFISFGLTSNDCTHLYLHDAPSPLFEVVEDDRGSEFVKLKNGHEFRSTERRQYGLIARHAPDPAEAPSRRWLLVAGLGPVGTTGAGWYLARHWRTLARQVPADRDFVAVLSVGSYTDRTPRLEEVVIGEPRSTGA
ncbi:hypothetical protein GCM10020367_27030 [Streptomyces sannanensis]|uniref:Uncharacterized protein n=1 Tax=Streptomyces sannanensis TaxID=285536 RepID=A0ABP6SAW7_9ACTN